MNTPVIRPTVAESVTVTTSWPHVATVAAVEAITESKVETIVESKQGENETPCADKDKECTRRWIDSISDCC